MAFAVQFLGAIVVVAVAIVVVAVMHVPDTVPDEPADLPLPDGNTRGDDLLTWAAEHPDRTHAPEYLEDL
ncbi:hypothetical protein [Lentzea xinjiangensis]|uniref:hypothetical protein n=1 Tax=Lentzea xinjiangensis TaxID=402600 RepID=UPI0011608937|nr:hypothetical protein [Lentzea xinjiangensis]